MTLEQFMQQKRPHESISIRAWVEFPGMAELYVRRGPYLIREWGGERFNTIQLANFEVEHQGQGTFRRLIDFLSKNHPDHVIFIECVLSKKLADICLHMGFEQVNRGTGLHFAMRSTGQ